MKLLQVFFLLSLFSFSQHTERFKQLTKELKKNCTKTDTVYFKNGKIEYIIQVSSYCHNNELFKTQTGKSVVCHKNGTIAREDLQDDFGNWLVSKYYDRSGNLTKEWITTEIDTNAKNLNEFFNSIDHINFKRTINFYRFSRRLGKRYKYKEEHITLINNIAEGSRNYLNEGGQIIQTKKLQLKKLM